MPKRFITYSRTEPARTILFSVAVLTVLMQVGAVLLTGAWAAIPNALVVAGVCIWSARACVKNNMAHMTHSSFVLFLMWLWSGLQRVFVLSPDVAQLLWFPMVIVAVVLAVVYLYLSHARKGGTNE